MLGLNHYAQKAISAIHRNVETWRRHQSLWKTERGPLIEKFRTKKPTTAEFQERLSKYHKVFTPSAFRRQFCGVQLSMAMLKQAKCVDVEFVTIDAHGVATSVGHVANDWVQAISHAMKENDQPKHIHFSPFCSKERF